MVELISDYTLENIIHSSLDDINEQGFLLWILHADKIPPHIGISFEGKFYSLKANGKDHGVDVNSIKSIIERKKITTLIVEMRNEAMKSNINSCFCQYEETVPHEITCLDPIKVILGYPQTEKLTELLKVLVANNEIVTVHGINTEKFEGIVDYDVKAIHTRLEKLENGK